MKQRCVILSCSETLFQDRFCKFYFGCWQVRLIMDASHSEIMAMVSTTQRSVICDQKCGFQNWLLFSETWGVSGEMAKFITILVVNCSLQKWKTTAQNHYTEGSTCKHRIFHSANSLLGWPILLGGLNLFCSAFVSRPQTRIFTPIRHHWKVVQLAGKFS